MNISGSCVVRLPFSLPNIRSNRHAAVRLKVIKFDRGNNITSGRQSLFYKVVTGEITNQPSKFITWVLTLGDLVFRVGVMQAC